MAKRVLLAVLLTVVAVTAFGQAKTRKFSSTINHPSINVYAPYISLDGNALVFLSDNTEGNVIAPFFTLRSAADWREPQSLPKHVHSRLSSNWSYALNADGSKMLFSTMKGPGVGGFDIVLTEYKANAWGEPINFGLPVNTKAHEGAPSLSADGSTLYFMRCTAMDQQSSSGCSIYRAQKKSNGQWDEPQELPSMINTGNSQSPRIMADNETLYFSSDKITPNRGGMDLYMTRFDGVSWSNPIPMDFVNTSGDDQHISVTAVGRYLLKDQAGQRKNELVEHLIPPSVKPKGMMKVEGRITDEKSAFISSYITVVDLIIGKKVFNGRPAKDGSFLLYLKEGSMYEVSVDPDQNDVMFFSRKFDLTGEHIPQSEKMNVTLKTLATGDEILLNTTQFVDNSAQLDMSVSIGELRRLSRLITAHKDKRFQINVGMTGYVKDSIQSTEDLTEVVYDTIVYEYHGVDSLGADYTEDSIAVETRYHNDRTQQQANAIGAALISLGVPEDRVEYAFSAMPAAIPEEKKLILKVVVK